MDNASQRAPLHAPVLSVVIPALDEESVIASTIQRCLDAREELLRSDLGGLELIVVNDGSTDRTETIALSFPQVTVLGFDRNRGYGAALKTGFAHARGELLAFMDADGTCDPRAFAQLCRPMLYGTADVALGLRLGGPSRMPPVRVLGNLFFAWLLRALSGRPVRDTASGMRVLRREALQLLQPLPDGLHFTPAMSARILMEGRLRLVEVPIPYADRVGHSKLSAIKDGLRFLRAIVHAALCYQPARPILAAALVLAVIAIAVGLMPTTFYLREQRLEEGMIMRILLASLAATLASLLGAVAIVVDRIAVVAHRRPAEDVTLAARLARLVRDPTGLLFIPALLALAFAMVFPGLLQFLFGDHITMHWSRAVLASLLVVVAVIHGATWFVVALTELIRVQISPSVTESTPDRVRVGAVAGHGLPASSM